MTDDLDGTMAEGFFKEYAMLRDVLWVSFLQESPLYVEVQRAQEKHKTGTSASKELGIGREGYVKRIKPMVEGKWSLPSCLQQ